MPRTDDSLITARRIAEAIIAVVNDTPTGAPGDLLFAPLQQWITREQFEQTMRVLVEAQRIAQCAGRYFPIRTTNTRPHGGRPGATQKPPLPGRPRISKPKLTVTPQECKARIVGKKIAVAVTAAISACANGAPAPLIYAPLSPWLSYDQFKALMARLVKNRLLRCEGNVYYPADEEAVE